MAGSIGFDGLDGLDGDMGMPGPAGVAGAAGSAGAAGATGPMGPPGMWGIDAEEPSIPFIIPGPKGDTGAAGGAGVGWTHFTQDLGAARCSGTFDITSAGLTADQNVSVVQTARAISSKGNARDEFEMDNIECTSYVVDAVTMRVYWNSPSVSVGTYAFAYLVNA